MTCAPSRRRTKAFSARWVDSSVLFIPGARLSAPCLDKLLQEQRAALPRPVSQCGGLSVAALAFYQVLIHLPCGATFWFPPPG